MRKEFCCAGVGRCARFLVSPSEDTHESDRGEQVQIAAVREAREECGLEVRLERLINIYSYPGRTPIIIVYLATAIGGDLCTDDECLEAGVFTPDEIPWDDLAFRSTHEALREYLKKPPD